MTFLKVFHPPNPISLTHSPYHNLRLTQQFSLSDRYVSLQLSATWSEHRQAISCKALNSYMATWQHGSRCVLLPDTVQWAARNAIPTEHCTGFERGWNLGLWFPNAFYQLYCKSWDLKGTQNVQIHVRNVWNFAALLRIKFIFEHRCANCILSYIMSDKRVSFTTTHIPALTGCPYIVFSAYLVWVEYQGGTLFTPCKLSVVHQQRYAEFPKSLSSNYVYIYI